MQGIPLHCSSVETASLFLALFISHSAKHMLLPFFVLLHIPIIAPTLSEAIPTYTLHLLEYLWNYLYKSLNPLQMQTRASQWDSLSFGHQVVIRNLTITSSPAHVVPSCALLALLLPGVWDLLFRGEIAISERLHVNLSLASLCSSREHTELGFDGGEGNALVLLPCALKYKCIL